MPVDLQIDWFFHVKDLVPTDDAFSNVFFIYNSLLAQLVKNPPACGRPIFDPYQPLGWKDPLEKGMAAQSSILAQRIPWIIHVVTKSQMWLSDFHFANTYCKKPNRTSCDEKQQSLVNFFLYDSSLLFTLGLSSIFTIILANNVHVLIFLDISDLPVY